MGNARLGVQALGPGERLPCGPLLRRPHLEPPSSVHAATAGAVPGECPRGLGCWRRGLQENPWGRGRPECQVPHRLARPRHTGGQGLWVSGAGSHSPSLGVSLSGGCEGMTPRGCRPPGTRASLQDFTRRVHLGGQFHPRQGPAALRRTTLGPGLSQGRPQPHGVSSPPGAEGPGPTVPWALLS